MSKPLAIHRLQHIDSHLPFVICVWCGRGEEMEGTGTSQHNVTLLSVSRWQCTQWQPIVMQAFVCSLTRACVQQ